MIRTPQIINVGEIVPADRLLLNGDDGPSDGPSIGFDVLYSSDPQTISARSLLQFYVALSGDGATQLYNLIVVFG